MFYAAARVMWRRRRTRVSRAGSLARSVAHGFRLCTATTGTSADGRHRVLCAGWLSGRANRRCPSVLTSKNTKRDNSRPPPPSSCHRSPVPAYALLLLRSVCPYVHVDNPVVTSSRRRFTLCLTRVSSRPRAPQLPFARVRNRTPKSSAFSRPPCGPTDTPVKAQWPL